MNERIDDKISKIEDYLSELLEIIPDNIEEYKRNLKEKAACERYFEKIVEAVVDLAFLIIREKDLGIPESDKEAFDILVRNNLISKELASRLKEAKGMRNVIAHEYGKIDDNLVFYSTKEELENDVKEFIKAIKGLK